MKQVISALAVAFLTACTWVRLTPEGNNVTVLSTDGANNCRRVAETTVSVRDKVVFRRSAARVAGELETLARNSAAERGGNAIVVTSPVNGGQRNYDIYQCGN